MSDCETGVGSAAKSTAFAQVEAAQKKAAA
jgi:hypothetical protein